MLVLDVFAVAVASYSFLLCRPFVGANGVLLVLGMMGEKEILRLILSLSLFFMLWLILSEAWKMEWERPILVDLCLLGVVPS